MARIHGLCRATRRYFGAVAAFLFLWCVLEDMRRVRDGEKRGREEEEEIEVLLEESIDFHFPIRSSPMEILQLDYVLRPPPPRRLITGSSNTKFLPPDERLQKPDDYYRYLHQPQFWCRKLVMLGGTYMCGLFGDENGMDGNKLVCLDPPLELPPGPDATQCLALSFGTQTEVSFDEALLNLPCEVHMFDILDYNPDKVLRQSRHAHFHAVGLASNRHDNFYLNMNKSYPMDSLVGHLIANNLTFRPIHILKVDIENDEWEVFRQLTKEPVLDFIGQIALEVHSHEILDYPSGEALDRLQMRYDVLKSIEARGFRRAAYWDNEVPRSRFLGKDGKAYDTSGEILYVNERWYDTAFKRRLVAEGIAFRGT